MALETQYVIGADNEHGYPVIARCIILDGAEISRGEADFVEVKAAYPDILPQYFDAIAAWARELADYTDAQSDFSADMYVRMRSASRFFYDFLQKYDYMSIADQMPQYQAPEAVAEEETPVAE